MSEIEQINKEDIVTLISRQTGYKRSAVTEVYESLVDIVVNSMARGKKVNITGIGVLEPRLRAARTGRNMHNGQPVPIPARTLPYFTPSDRLKEAVSRSKKEDKAV